MSEILYHDKIVTIYRDLIVINKYYFPLLTSRTIFVKDIQFVSLVPSEGAKHRWGTTPKFLNNWFPYDPNRYLKDQFIEIRIKGKKTRPSFSPENPQAAFAVIWQNFSEEGKKAVEQVVRKSATGSEKETEMCQQEMMEREKALEEANEEKKQKLEPKPVEVVQVQNLD